MNSHLNWAVVHSIEFNAHIFSTLRSLNIGLQKPMICYLVTEITSKRSFGEVKIEFKIQTFGGGAVHPEPRYDLRNEIRKSLVWLFWLGTGIYYILVPWFLNRRDKETQYLNSCLFILSFYRGGERSYAVFRWVI